MNADGLNSLILSGQPFLLIDVLPDEVHAARHIAGSTNLCVFETAFIAKVAELGLSRDKVIVVYGAGGGSHDAADAARKLSAEGYSNVMVLDGGIEAWSSAGFPVRGHGKLPEPPPIDGIYQVDTAESVIRWTGRNLFNHHSGTVRLSGGTIAARQGVLESARFIIDMASIACEDLADSEWNGMLIRHLLDADFFDVEKFPTAVFEVAEAHAIAGASEGTPNFVLRGSLTLRGVTRPLEFPAVVASADGSRLTGQAHVELDRTEFGSVYGSGRFFRFLGKHVVNDHMQLHLKLHAAKA